ncbi:MAG TPA: sigma-70 family RNA polymerase sigma factor [Firmicutes bacterium]|nr:sigma-70 family RNA polymerase sigma factor [Bacillota bacterium]
MAVYMRAAAPDNDETIERLKRNLRLARRQELTPRQAQMLYLYFDREMTMEQVGKKLGVTKSTVSRTISRAERRLKRCLRYAF